MRQKQLFPTPRAANFTAAVSVLKPVVIPILWKAHKDVFDNLSDRITQDAMFQRLRPWELAQFAHRQIVDHTDSLLKEYGNGIPFEWQSEYRMDILNVNDEVLLCFKKLRKDLTRSNFPTAHNVEFWTQAGTESPLKLIVGYVPNAAWSDSRLYLTLPGNRRVAEWERIEDQAPQFIQFNSSKRPVAAAGGEQRRFTAKPKKIVDRGKATGTFDGG